MHARIPSAAVAIASLILLPVTPALAGVTPGAPIYIITLPPSEFGSLNFTALLVKKMTEAQKFCAEIGNTAYNVDCLAERLGVVANDIPKDSDYREVQDALKTASNRLGKLARAHRDPALPRGRATRPGSSGETTTRPLTPVTTASLPQVNQEALAILQETQTMLLRSAGSSQSKLLHYQRIANAIGSNKVLLRSA